MAGARDERINQALEGLVESLLPQAEEDDDAAADHRYFTSLETAQDTIDSAPHPSIAQDEAHVADLITRRFLHTHDTPDRALRFSNLYDRLLSQPVLDRKWAHLYLLHLLSPPPKASNTPSHRNTNASSRLADLRQDARRSESPATARPSSLRVMDDAFARDGIPTYPEREPEREIPQRPPVTSRRRDKPSAMTNGYATHTLPDRTGWGGKTEPSEASLLRDLPFILQGISTANFAFISPTTITLPRTLPGPLIALLHTLSEPGLLYYGLARFQESSDGGLVTQSLRAAISTELRAYLALVASLEGQIRRAAQASEDSATSSAASKGAVTLKRCVVWTRDATMGLRLMALLVEEAATRKGGQLITLIHSFASTHGDPFVSTFAERLLTHVTRPFYAMLRTWIYDGELSDPYQEFFVSENHTDGEDRAGYAAISVWEDKYKLDRNMVPTIMTEDFANKVFLIGKSLNFIRHSCADSAWVESYSRDSSHELIYGDTATLVSSIDAAYATTMARLLHLMNSKFRLNAHLTALKSYLLLSAGDFTALLLESLASNLDRPAATQFRHTLTAQLEHAIRNSNAQYDAPDVLNRLDARMLNHSHGDIGWDVFTLEYKIDAPVDVVVTPAGAREYLKVFNFLWRVKRVEFALGTIWRRLATGARGVLRDVESGSRNSKGRDKSAGRGAKDGLAQDWKEARCTIAEMEHFVVQLQYYILFEVIEASWAALQKAISAPDATLDDVIAAHARYLKSITRKGLLGRGHLEFTTQLHELLKGMMAYKEVVEGLYAYSNQVAVRRMQRSARIERRTGKGGWGVSERDELDAERDGLDADSPLPPPLLGGSAGGGGAGGAANDDATVLTALRQRMRDLSADFRAKVCVFLGDLAYQPDTDLRFLGVTMNWNDTYKITRRSRRRQEGGSSDAPSTGVRPSAAAAGGHGDVATGRTERVR